jgi:hypothetical protein
MEPLDVFTVRDLRQRSGDLLRDAEQGRLALITKHGRPAGRPSWRCHSRQEKYVWALVFLTTLPHPFDFNRRDSVVPNVAAD